MASHSKEEAKLAAWAREKMRGLLSPADVEKLLSLLKANNISSLPLLKSMSEADLLKVRCLCDLLNAKFVWQICSLQSYGHYYV